MSSKIDLEGRLRSRLNAWKQIDSNEKVLKWIEEGVPITFVSKRCKTYISNPRFTKIHETFIKEELIRLTLNGAIEKCSNKPLYISPLNVVPKKNGKFRLITNLKELNKSVRRETFRNEDIRVTIDLVEKDDYMVSIDLKDCFFHIAVQEIYRDFLGFMFKGEFYRWRVLPFGLSISSFYCNKVIRPIIAYLRINFDMKVQVYVDDFFLCAPLEKITDHKDMLITTLQELGWIINFDKSI